MLGILIVAIVEIADEGGGEVGRIEIAQIVDALAHADLDDGQLQLVRDGERDAAFRRAVELGDDERVQIERAVELACLLQAVLAGRRVDDEHRVDGQARALARDVDDLLQLAHEVGRRVQAAGRVDEDQIRPDGLGALDRVVAHARRIGAALARDHLDVGAARPDLELLDGGGAERVGRAQDHRAARVGRLLGDLADRGGLAGAVDADEQDERLLAAEDVLPSRREGLGDVLAQQVEHRIGVGKRLAPRGVAQTLDDVGGRHAADIREDERLLERLPEFLVKIGAAVKQNVHLLLEPVA